MMSIILSKIIGLYFLCAGLAILFNYKHFKKLYMKLAKNDSFCFIGGIIALFFGAFIISLHNDWVMAWPVFITIIGWLSLIKGFWLLICYKCTPIFKFFAKRSHAFFVIDRKSVV